MGVPASSAIEASSSAESNPCITCGACCAHFRVGFYWSEADSALGGTVPAELTRPISPFKRCMLGTDSSEPRCIALAGEVGRQVRCTIYDRRPSPCREFAVSGVDGVVNPQCESSRAAFGLPPLPTGSLPDVTRTSARPAPGIVA